eukprot:9623314-Prorocentrum_lima.AAC.1
MAHNFHRQPLGQLSNHRGLFGPDPGSGWATGTSDTDQIRGLLVSCVVRRCIRPLLSGGCTPPPEEGKPVPRRPIQ